MIVKATAPIYADRAAKLVELTGSFTESIYIKKGDRTADGKSFLGIIALSIYPDEPIEIICDPPSTDLKAKLLSSGLFASFKN
ncbi:HPr family phosphocarrier protein [Fictibacillus nanhaiensis]|uniref:HPr family phosphocarrier protein n=1 Tax=Fictibacillus nanhaiensis TaxID=742169 RepID=UPI001C95E981|nr:HPr family phosphocarrier protein [Fictibacillus nanhaiensis]MBY6035600.1 HPr family phosphocarrier protein [Fictibacillus nanhaiensis]